MAWWKVTDTITFQREWHVQAPSADAAIEKVEKGGVEPRSLRGVDRDNDPYEAVALEDEH